MSEPSKEAGIEPSVHRMKRIGSVWLAESAVVAGDVTLEEDCNIWHHCVLRGDVAPIRLGRRVNVQDGSILHCNHDVPLEIGDDAVIGHGAVVHCHSVGARTLIAIRATILDDCEIGNDCLIAAGSLLPPRTRIPPGSVVMGMPGKVVREIRDEERDYIRRVNEVYIELARSHEAGEYKPPLAP